MARIIEGKLLFIHVARTGGTFVRECLNYHGVSNWESGTIEVEEHYSHHTSIQKHPALKNLFSFGFVRHPSTWYLSQWKWAMKTDFGLRKQFDPVAKRHWMNDVWSVNFNIFLRNVLEQCPGKCTEYFNAMLNGVDKVYRYEKLEEACIDILENELNHEYDKLFKLKSFKETRKLYREQKPQRELLDKICETEKIINQFYA